MTNLKHMEFIVTLALTKSFTKAAKKLKISQPLLSKTVMSLEEDLKVKLFERTTPLTLTQAGEIYVSKAKIMLEIYDDLNLRLASLCGITKGKIKIGFSQTSYKMISPLLPKFYKNFPNADIKVIQTSSALDIRKKLIDDEIDIAMLIHPINTDGLDYKEIKDTKVYLALPATHELAQKYRQTRYGYPKIAACELKNEKFILPRGAQRNRLEFDEIFKKAGFTPNVFCESETADITISMVASGIGACFVPLEFITREAMERIALFEIEGMELKQTLIAAYKSGKRLSNLAKEFIKMARNEADNAAI